MGLLLLLAAACSHAAITCTTISSPGWTTGYVKGTTAGTQVPFTITCTRGSTSDPTSVSYGVQVNNGLQPHGVNNFAALGNTTLSYDLFTTGCPGTQWKGNLTISGSVNWASGSTGNETSTQYFWACIYSAQSPTAAGNYTDSVTMTATYGSSNATVSGTIPISIYAPASCVINPSPGDVSIVYPAFSPIPLSGSTSFGATCTSGMPYGLDISPASGTLAGVNYNVTLSAASGAGTGSLQNYTVTVTAPAGQGGTCATPSCMATQTHTLTITY